MESAGFKYIDHSDEVRCDSCNLEISNWTSEMKPFAIHSQRSPTCPFVLSMLPPNIITKDTINRLFPTISPSLQSVFTDTTSLNMSIDSFMEVDIVKQVRKRTFSHWPHSSSSSQMIEAGFFSCNVGDRVMCIYCNLICQQWNSFTDDPCDVHKTLSPNCPYVRAMLISSSKASLLIVNDHSTQNQSSSLDSSVAYRCDVIVPTTAINQLYMEIPKRYASFSNWPSENLPAVDDLVRSGFFYTGDKTIVTCFYCNGSLQNWGANDKPLIEHVRWFPHCAYAKQLCDNKTYERVQHTKRLAQQEKNHSNQSNGDGESNNNGSLHDRLQIPDENTLVRLVAARLDLPISVSLVKRGFKPSVVKRCWEDQLRLKHEDFVSECDLLMACTILQKQIECIAGKKENILTPEKAMKKIREEAQTEIHHHTPTTSNSTSSDKSNTIELTEAIIFSLDSLSAIEQQQTVDDKKLKDNSEKSEKNMSSSINYCALCLEEPKCLACIPCGHLATCIPCGHSLRTCPICRNTIQAFMRIYV